jgi:hypothetical protein
VLKQNLNHVDHVLWICWPENQAEFARQLSELCRVEFHGPVERPEVGTRIYISWSAGLEIIAPTRDDGAGDDWRARHDYVLAFAATPATGLRRHFEDCLPLARDVEQAGRLKRAIRLIDLVSELTSTGVT